MEDQCIRPSGAGHEILQPRTRNPTGRLDRHHVHYNVFNDVRHRCVGDRRPLTTILSAGTQSHRDRMDKHPAGAFTPIEPS